MSTDTKDLREKLESVLNQNDCYTEVRVGVPDGSSYITTAHALMIDDILALIAAQEIEARVDELERVDKSCSGVDDYLPFIEGRIAQLKSKGED